ncbi:MAG TPA: SCP2 sterol-binding domain-containing protein [Verrucomicrobiae bacterium]|nr:SCP2 sterol-binding domain-containing protein [Verrucomicrobiae bacterium]
MTAPALLCAGLEIALNRYLALEPAVLEEIGRLKGRCLALEAEGPGWEFFLCPHAAGVQVLDAWPGKPDVRIRARPTQLLRQAMRAGAGEGSALTGVHIEGDAGLLQQFSTLLARVGFDLGEWLAKYMDGGAAHRTAEALRGLLGWSRSTASTLALDTAEYLREETRDLPHRAEVEQWAEGVGDLRARVDGFAARLARLARPDRRA